MADPRVFNTATGILTAKIVTRVSLGVLEHQTVRMATTHAHVKALQVGRCERAARYRL